MHEKLYSLWLREGVGGQFMTQGTLFPFLWMIKQIETTFLLDQLYLVE